MAWRMKRVVLVHDALENTSARVVRKVKAAAKCGNDVHFYETI